MSDALPVLPAPPSESAAVAAAPVRAANLTRSLFHVGCGVLSLTLLRLVPVRGWLIAVSGAFALAGWTMELSRRRSRAVNDALMRLFAPVAHPHERHRVNSSTWYVTALFLLSLVAPLRAAEVGLLVLALADPAAGLVGRRFGRTRLRAQRSLEGSLAFLATGLLAGLGWLCVAHGMSWRAALVVAAVAAVAGTLVELISTRLDDNFTIPLAVTAAAAGGEWLLR